MMRKKQFAALMLCVSLLLAACAAPRQATIESQQQVEQPKQGEEQQSGRAEPPEQPEQGAEVTPPEPVEQRVTLMAVGDIMVHQEQLDAAWNDKSKSYDFYPFFQKVEPLLKQADLVVGNLETTLSGKEAKFTGYPMFNSPESLATTLKQVGFTAVTTANNHSMDRREAGVLKTIEHVEQAGLLHTGTFRSAEERDMPLMLEKNGIKLGIAAYSYGTNGIPVPEGKPYLINLIDQNLIRKDIAAAKTMGADLVAVALHFGVEYQRQPNDQQRKIVDQVFDAGADLIIGHHPHVVQPYEWRELPQADGSIRKGLVIYSLGNFVSAQRGDYKDVGAILKVVIKKGENGNAVLEEADVIPTYVLLTRPGGKRHYVIYPLAETLQAYKEKKEPQLTEANYQFMEKLLKEMTVFVAKPLAQKKTG